ncbi:hypothetical protein CLIB1444_14S01596 [[Candida] jaroonii]|uniref:Uncharacterized protein n=1 Tax=[Candida] jaroonii TaxID=467808 RepID=A0ACA9YEM3_9ASCO|nr:hypothetical protein CLIB1444_14S01596 [[Candida] jaroonii]
MAVSERNMKRKVELEDITNTNTNYNKKMKQMNFKKKLQQRSPSPFEGELKSPKKYKKDYGKSVTFENSPLLTPKEEDYQDEPDIVEINMDIPSSVGDCDLDDSVNPFDAVQNNDDDDNDMFNDSDDNVNKKDLTNDHLGQTSDELQSRETNDVCDPQNSTTDELISNPDYIALTSSLRLLNNNKSKIETEILQLSKLYSNFDNIQNDGEVIDFFVKLVKNELNLPKQNKILKSPIINWSKYNLEVENNGNKFNKNYNDKPLFKTLNLFNNESK